MHWNQNKSWNEPWRDIILSNTLLLQMRKTASKMRLFSQGYISSISIIVHRPYGRFLLESLSEMTVVEAGVRVIWNRITCKEFYSLIDSLHLWHPHAMVNTMVFRLEFYGPTMRITLATLYSSEYYQIFYLESLNF